MSNVSITPLPWSITGQSHKDYEGAEIGSADKTVAVILCADAAGASPEEQANGQYIVRAANLFPLVTRRLHALLGSVENEHADFAAYAMRITNSDHPWHEDVMQTRAVLAEALADGLPPNDAPRTDPYHLADGGESRHQTLVRLLLEAHQTMLEGYSQSGDWYNEAARLLGATATPVTPRTAPYHVAIVFGDEDTRAVEEDNAAMGDLDTFAVKSFGTQGERQAYLRGLQDAQGWDGFHAKLDPEPPEWSGSPDPQVASAGNDPFMDVEPTHALAVLREVHKQYGKLHDMLSDCIEDGRLTKAMLPDDYKALADQLAACVGTDQHVKEAMKDTASAALDERETLVHASFVIDGLHAAGYNKVIDKWQEGATELHDQLMFCVPVIRAARMAAEAAGAHYPGVFDYEVSVGFGQWSGERVIETGFLPPQNESVGYICGAVQHFFSDSGRQVDHKVNAAIDAAVRPFLIDDETEAQ